MDTNIAVLVKLWELLEREAEKQGFTGIGLSLHSADMKNFKGNPEWKVNERNVEGRKYHTATKVGNDSFGITFFE